MSVVEWWGGDGLGGAIAEWWVESVDGMVGSAYPTYCWGCRCGGNETAIKLEG